jgi:hypothetical protein
MGEQAIGHKVWIIPDGYLPKDSSGGLVSHEAICVLNTGERDANIRITVYFEDREPMDRFYAVCAARRTNHIRLEGFADKDGHIIPLGVPYALKVESDEPIVVQHSRMDTTQAEMALMTVMGYPVL